ncbi:ubiquitin family protein [Ceratobasidium sp. AG-Ba]|nr:ubiquitin family protein [Ceratobasidium sp. AG-Ba]
MSHIDAAHIKRVDSDNYPSAGPECATNQDSSSQLSYLQQSTMKVYIRTITSQVYSIDIEPYDTIGDLKSKIEEKDGIPTDQQRLVFAGKMLEDKNTLNHYDIQKECLIHQVVRLRGGKPVVYLLPPAPTNNIRVDLALTQAWDFSALYPPTPICPTVGGGQSVSWIVDAKPDGTLFEHGTGREVSYLFGKHSAYLLLIFKSTQRHPTSSTNPALPCSPAVSRPGSPVQEVASTFDPSRPVITPSNSTVLPFEKVTGYIDDVLLSLGLHTEARCSFITYWLPDLQQHKHIALRFLPQSEYEAAAPMDVTPSPDVTTRVFMLFRGVEESNIDAWRGAVKDVCEWKSIVGVDAQKATDINTFRVLEWGGME